MNTDTATTELARRFENRTDDMIYIVIVHGDEGSYVLGNGKGALMGYESRTDAQDILDGILDTGAYGEVEALEPYTALDLDNGPEDLLGALPSDEDDCGDDCDLNA